MANLLKERYDALVARWVALPGERREALLRDFVVDYVYNSEKIENEELQFSTVRGIVEKDAVTGYTGDVDVLVETRNLKLSWDLARVKLVEDPCLSEELIQQAQELVTMGTYREKLLLAGERPGTFKLENYVGGPATLSLATSLPLPRAAPPASGFPPSRSRARLGCSPTTSTRSSRRASVRSRSRHTCTRASSRSTRSPTATGAPRAFS